MSELTLIRPDDFHLHLRQGDLMRQLVEETAKSFARVLVMPNTIPPVTLAEDVVQYREDLEGVGTALEFLMTFKIMPETSSESVRQLKEVGTMAGKLYPIGVTTNAEDGIRRIRDCYEVFEALQELEMVLCLHGEVPGVEDLLREAAFLPELKQLHQDFPRLRIVLEHASTKAAVEMVQSLGEMVAATLTVHHLLLTTAEVRDGVFYPHHFCAPICKSEADRAALLSAAVSGDPKFFLGSDSAPHLREQKEGDHPKPGVYSTPVVLPLLAQIFEDHHQLDRLEAFVAQHGANFYQLPQNSDTISLAKQPWQVPEEYYEVVPLSAGETLKWQVV